jgi:hypothetical protein
VIFEAEWGLLADGQKKEGLAQPFTLVSFVLLQRNFTGKITNPY